MTLYWEDDRSYRQHSPANWSFVGWGRCRSGRRWFWGVELDGGSDHGGTDEHGYADSETDAERNARAAIRRMAVRHPDADVIVYRSSGIAPRVRKRVNATKRRARPPADTTDSAPVEYLYGVSHLMSDDSRYPDEWTVVPFQVTKKTPKRIYYIRRAGWPGEDPEIGYVDRRALERDGEIYNRGRHWCMDDYHLHAEPPDLRPQREAAPDLSQLRQEMADAHPDRGGDRDTFTAARTRYLRAQRSAG